jgi:Flp pilus assembly pilin Flp
MNGNSPPSVLDLQYRFQLWRSALMQKLYTLLTREDGQTMAEYGVVLAVITIAVFGALALLSGNIVNALTRVAGFIS